MKKILIAAMAVLMGLSLIGCGIGKKDSGGTETTAATETTTQEQTTQEQTTKEEPTTQTPVSGSDPVTFQLDGIDEDLGMYQATGLKSIILTESGSLVLRTYGNLASSEGNEVVIANDVLGADLFTFGNNGYRVLLFVRKDGSVSMVDPIGLIDKHRIEVVDNLGGLKNITEIYEELDGDGTIVIAKDRDGTTTVLDEYFY